jgi:serine/threonine protein kinase
MLCLPSTIPPLADEEPTQVSHSPAQVKIQTPDREKRRHDARPVVKFILPPSTVKPVSQSVPPGGELAPFEEPPREIVLSRYEIWSAIDNGAFGQVSRCYDRQKSALFAVKVTNGASEEAAIMRHLSKAIDYEDSCVVTIENQFAIGSRQYFVMELLGQNLYELRKRGRFSTFQLRSLALDILTAIAFCHRNGVIHTDIKPENIVALPNCPNHAKLIDFGTSCFIGIPVFEYVQSRYYRAPEIIFATDYGPPMDIWSFGCVLAEMAIGVPLFPGMDEVDLVAKIIAFLGPPPDTMCPFTDWPVEKDPFFVRAVKTEVGDKLVLDLILQCLEWDPASRITAEEALEHPFFKERINKTR